MRDDAQKRPEIGETIDADGVKTNYLEAGAGPPVVLIHGSGPGVTAYANWRLVIPALGRLPRDRARHGRLRLLRAAERRRLRRADLGRPGGRPARQPRPGQASIVGNSFGGAIALRVATQHPDRVDKLVLMGSMGVDFPITEGLDRVWGYEPSFENMRGVLDVFAYNRETGSRRAGRGALPGQHAARLPGVVRGDVPRAAPALGRRDAHAGRRDPRARAPDADRARPRGPGHPGRDLAGPDAPDRQRRTCTSSRTAGTGRRSSGRPTSTGSWATSCRPEAT